MSTLEVFTYDDALGIRQDQVPELSHGMSYTLVC